MHAKRCCHFLVYYLPVRRKRKGKREGGKKKPKRKEVGNRFKKKTVKSFKKEQPLRTDQSPAKHIFCPIRCPKSKAWTQQAPARVLPTQQDGAKPPGAAALSQSPAHTSPGPPASARRYIAQRPPSLSSAACLWLLLLALDSSQQNMSQYSGKVSNDPVASLAAWGRRARASSGPESQSILWAGGRG